MSTQQNRQTEREAEAASVLDGIEIATPKALEALSRSEIDVQIATAKRWPRRLSVVRQEVKDRATVDAETADRCFYKLKRRERGGGEKIITGPSVRFAEIVLSAWGNVRHTTEIIDVGEDFVLARATVHDLQNNNFHAAQAVRSIKSKAGGRYSQDMIQTTAMAAASIALRNATFRIIPLAEFTEQIAEIEAAALGNADTRESRRKALFDYFTNKLNVSMAKILGLCEKASEADLTADDVVMLRGVARAIKDGETTADEFFRDVEPAKLTPARASEAANSAQAALEEATKGGGA